MKMQHRKQTELGTQAANMKELVVQFCLQVHTSGIGNLFYLEPGCSDNNFEQRRFNG